MNKLKIVQIGVGNFGAARRDRMRETGLFDIIAAYDLNEDFLKTCCEEEGAEPVGSYEELLAFPDAEAVIISTGAKFHAEQIIAAAEKGLHVFVEKPLCSTAAELNSLLEMQKKSGVVIGLGHNDHTEMETSQKIKQMIDSKEIGNIVAFEKTTCHSGGQMIKPGDWRGDPEKNPGGMLFQCGVHAFHELIYYFGAVKSIKCTMRYDAHSGTKTADAAICIIEFESGVIGSLNAYHVSPYRHTLNIFGTKRNIYKQERFFDEGTTMFYQEDFLDGDEQPLHKVPLQAIEGKNDKGGNLRSFYNAIRNGGEPYPSLQDGARAVACVFAALESSRNGQIVELRKFV